MTYNPLIFDECIRYISENQIPFNKSVDILIKQDMDITAEDDDERVQAFKNAEIVLSHFKKFYSDRMIRVTKFKTYLMGIDTDKFAELVENMDEDEIMDKIKELEEGFEEYEQYRDLYNSERMRYTRPNFIQRKNAKKNR